MTKFVTGKEIAGALGLDPAKFEKIVITATRNKVEIKANGTLLSPGSSKFLKIIEGAAK